MAGTITSISTAPDPLPFRSETSACFVSSGGPEVGELGRKA
nr:hypothetical protein [Candidatus Microthrix sp.]